MDDEELLELISERKTISKTVEDYEGRKSTSLTTAVSVLCLSCLLLCCSIIFLHIIGFDASNYASGSSYSWL